MRNTARFLNFPFGISIIALAKKMINELSIIFPLFNEEKRIKKHFRNKELKKVKERKVEIFLLVTVVQINLIY